MMPEDFEDWWFAKCPQFDPITTDHVLAAWQAAEPKWVSVAERMPPVDEYVLFLDGGKTMGHHPPFVYVDKINRRNECQRGYLPYYSHWMPLPEAESCSEE